MFVTIAYWLLYIPLRFPFLRMVAPVRSCCFLLQFPGGVLSGEEPTLAHQMNEQLGWGWDPVSRLLAQRAQRPGFFSQHRANWLWCCTSVTPALWRWSRIRSSGPSWGYTIQSRLTQSKWDSFFKKGETTKNPKWLGKWMQEGSNLFVFSCLSTWTQDSLLSCMHCILGHIWKIKQYCWNKHPFFFLCSSGPNKMEFL